MPQVYSDILLEQVGLVGSATTVPDPGFLWVVRDIELYWNPTAGIESSCFFIGDIGQTFFFNQFTIVGGERWGSFSGRVVIKDSLTATISGQAVDVTVSGYKLSLP